MKKAISISAIFIVVGFIAFNMLTNNVYIDSTDAVLVYNYNNVKITQKLTKDESQMIRKILNGKRLYDDNPSCGFTSDVSIKFGNMIFCIACDSCPVLRLDKSNKCISITQNERESIEKIFNKYGGGFPYE